MKSKKYGNMNIIIKLLMIVTFSFLIFCLVTAYQSKILNINTDGLVQIEYLNSGVQRIAKLELENNSDDEIIKLLDDTVFNFFLDDDNLNYFKKDLEMSRFAKQFANNWYLFKDSLLEYRETHNHNVFFSASEENYENASSIILQINEHINKYSAFVFTLEIVTVMHIFIIAMLLIRIFFYTLNELKKNKELSNSIDIDHATGVYNRSKCQEILDVLPDTKSDIERAVLVFDINDLRKTNELLGRAIGDDLIATFASMLKRAIKVSPYETFVGRCGGDEFMVCFPVAVEKDIEVYIEEINFLTGEFNSDDNNKFKLYFAVGYAITTPKTKSLTTRGLFDIADKNMFEHKIAMKELIRKNVLK